MFLYSLAVTGLRYELWAKHGMIEMDDMRRFAGILIKNQFKCQKPKRKTTKEKGEREKTKQKKNTHTINWYLTFYTAAQRQQQQKQQQHRKRFPYYRHELSQGSIQTIWKYISIYSSPWAKSKWITVVNCVHTYMVMVMVMHTKLQTEFFRSEHETQIKTIEI